MKFFTLTVSFLLIINCVSKAQSIVDTHPTASIFAIDYSTGQETPATFDAAILFKNALIDLVSNTTTAKLQLSKMVPGRKSFVITQMDPQTNGNAYQLVLQSKFLSQVITVYTFVYSVDQNSLAFYDTQTQSYLAVAIQGLNLNNLNNCYAYGKFNVQQPQNMVNAPVQQVDASMDAAPIDANVTATMVPPALPDYDQPECPVDGYLWQPGYWAFSQDTNGYYWVPGAWVAPPSIGVLWTPPYWGFDGGVYIFHTGYWGNTIGFYGGVNYGFGYGGVGFVGGDWHEGHFRYNTAVLRVNERVIHNTYIDRTVIVRNEGPRASFNGRGGVMARPNEHEIAAMKEHHIMATPEQNRNQRAARADKGQFASSNGGRPANVASERVMDTRPGGQGARPGMNGGADARQGFNGASGANQNGGQGTRPGMNDGVGARQGFNGASGANQSGGQGTRPGMNGGADARQGFNGASGANPGVPGGQGNRQGMNGAPGTNPSVPKGPPIPGGPGSARPGVPGGQGTKPGTNTNKSMPKKTMPTRTKPEPEKKKD